jgi:hypothetical protein
MVTVAQVRKVAMSLPRTTEHLIRDRVKFRVGQIVYVAFSRDETTMGFGYPREERLALIEAEPDKFYMPAPPDDRYQWVEAWMDRLDVREMRELVQEAWRMVVPKKVASERLGLPTPSLAAPDLAALARAGHEFAALGKVDASWHLFLADTFPALDLSVSEHRTLALAWLNSWGCRLPYSGTFDTSVARWASVTRLPETPALHELAEKEILALAAAYGTLSELSIGNRTLGPTAAAKLLYALRPSSVMPWDAAIATHLHGTRNAAAFAAHLRLGRQWAKALIKSTGFSAEQLSELAGRSGIPLSKVLDEYTYLLITRA